MLSTNSQIVRNIILCNMRLLCECSIVVIRFFWFFDNCHLLWKAFFHLPLPVLCFSNDVTLPSKGNINQAAMIWRHHQQNLSRFVYLFPISSFLPFFLSILTTKCIRMTNYSALLINRCIFYCVSARLTVVSLSNEFISTISNRSSSEYLQFVEVVGNAVSILFF